MIITSFKYLVEFFKLAIKYGIKFFVLGLPTDCCKRLAVFRLL